MKEIKRRALNFLICIDQLGWSVITLGHASPDETISAGAYRMEQEGKKRGKYARIVIDWIFTKLQEDHCRKAYQAEVDRKQSRFIKV